MSETNYKTTTPREVVQILESYRAARQRGYAPRLAFHYGDKETGRAWGDIETGYIGRSTGTVKIPLVIHNTRSMGGGALLDDCIVRISFANKSKGGDLYRHPNYHTESEGV